MSHFPNSSSVEQYGSVNTSNILRKRRRQPHQQLHNESSSDTIGKQQQQQHQRQHNPHQHYRYNGNRNQHKSHQQHDRYPQPHQSYLYNVQISLLVAPCLMCLFLLDNYFDNSHSSNNNNTLAIVTLYCVIVLYIIDLSNWKDGFYSSIWICLVLISFFLLWDFTTLESISSFSRKEAWISSKYGQNIIPGGGDIGGDDDELWIQLESWTLFLFSVLNLAAKIMFFYAMACWMTLQCQWIAKKSDVKRTDDIAALTRRHQYAKDMEQKLHIILPISFSTMISFFFLSYLCSSYHWSNVSSVGMNVNLWIFLPILFTICAAWTVKCICDLESSYSYYSIFYQKNNHNYKHDIDNSTTTTNNHYRNNDDNNDDDLENEYRYKEQQELQRQRKQQEQMYYLKYHHTIPCSYGTMLSKMILYSPFLIYILSYPTQRNQRLTMSSMIGLSSPSSLTSYTWSAILLDLVLVTFVPFLIHSLYLGNGLWWKRELSLVLYATEKKGKINKHGSRTSTMQSLYKFLPTLVVIEVVVHQYLIQLCLYFSQYLHHDEQNVHSKVIISILLHCGIGLLGLQWWRHQQLDRHNNNLMENLLGGGSDERDSIDESCIVMMLASGFCFGYALALPWHFMQYILTFCLGFGLYISTRKIRYMVVSMLVAIITMSTIYLNWFYLVDKSVWIIPGVAKVSILRFHIILATGSSSCGIIYALVTGRDDGILDKILQKVDVIGSLLVLYTFFVLCIEGVLLFEPLDSGFKSWQKDRLYSNVLVAMTSVLLTGAALLLKRSKAITFTTSLLVISLTIGKIIAASVRNHYISGNMLDKHGNFMSTSINSAFIIFVISAPFVLMRRVNLGKPKSKFDRKRLSFVPKTTSIMIALYCGGILPISIIISIPRVLKPIITMLLSGSEMSYMHSLLLSEIFGYSMSIWGIAAYSTLHYHLPNGGAEVWKRVGICGLVFGTLISFSAPTFTVFNSHNSTSSSIFTSISSMGDAVQKHDQEGIWGLITTALAILLAFCGPLDLRRNKANDTEDTLYFTRLIIFSIMSGCGSSWFLIFQLIGDMNKFYTALIVTSTTLISLTYTIASVLGYYVEVKDFGKAIRMGKNSLFIATATSLITGLLFALSIYKTVESSSPLISLWALYSFILGLSIRLRRLKSTKTRALSNLSFVLSWLLWTVVIYSRFGVASIGVAATYDYLLGMPTSVVFTLPLASILILVEVEPRRRYAKSTMNSNKQSYFGIKFETLSDKQRYLVPFVIAGMMLILVSFYAISIRGMDTWWLEKGSHTTYEDIFQSNYGMNSRTTHHDHLDIIAMAQKHLNHKKMVGVTSKLAASGFWTSNSLTGPIIHLIGLISVLPTWYLLSSFVMNAAPKISHTSLMASLPLNFFPLFFCRGIPSLTACAGLGVLVAAYKFYDVKRNIWIGKVTI